MLTNLEQPVRPQEEPDAVVGAGLALTHTRDGHIRLYTLDEQPVCIGDFDDVAAAWAALDALDVAA
jgi:hypothetical protein